MRDPDKVFGPIDDPDIIRDHVASFKRDLNRMGIDIIDKVVTDVGTGRQAIAASLLGAKHVYCYDISEQNVKNLTEYIRKNKIENITSRRVDLTQQAPQASDFVYLHGIVQHFSHTGRGLKNCLDAVNAGGHVWLYFYRSGTFKMFMIEMLRDLIGTLDIDEYFMGSTILYSENATPNYQVSGIMDDMFTEHINLYEPRTYIRFLEQAGFEVIFESKLYPLDAVNHSLHESVIVGAKRVREGAPDISLLSPKNSVKQLELTYDNEIINETVRAYRDLTNLSPNVRMILSMSLYRFLDGIYGRTTKENHQQIQKVLKNINRISL